MGLEGRQYHGSPPAGTWSLARLAVYGQGADTTSDVPWFYRGMVGARLGARGRPTPMSEQTTSERRVVPQDSRTALKWAVRSLEAAIQGLGDGARERRVRRQFHQLVAALEREGYALFE